MHYEDPSYFELDESRKDEAGVSGARWGEHMSVSEATTPSGRRTRSMWQGWRRKGPPRGGNRSAGLGGDNGRPNHQGAENHFVPWIPELLWSLLSLVCLAAIIAVMKGYDGQSLADWPLAIPLNGLVAFLEAICRVSLVVPLTEGLAQLKWNWFARRQRPLSDLQAFEDASRGTAGSIKFIFQRKGRALGMSAAVALLTCFASSPLTQMAISYPTRLVGSGDFAASVARGKAYAHPEYNSSSGKKHPRAITVLNAESHGTELDAREKVSIQQGVFHRVDERVLPIETSCGPEECRQSTFNSLAVCSTTVDLSERLVISNPLGIFSIDTSLGLGSSDMPVYKASLPNDLFLIGSASTYNLNVSSPPVVSTGSGQVLDSGSFLPAITSLGLAGLDARVSSAVANVFAIYTNQTAEVGQQSGTFRAVEILWYFCINKYTAAVSRGAGLSALVNSSAVVFAPVAAAVEAVPATVARRVDSHSSTATVLEARFEDETYVIRRDDVRLLNRYILSQFAGTYSSRRGKTAIGVTATSDALGTAMFARESTGSDDAGDAIANVTGNVATSLTNA